MTDEKQPHVNISAGGDVNADGDVVGRDKITTTNTTNITNYQEAPLAASPAAPPQPPAHFAGREATLEKLSQLLTSGENLAITAVQGMGGIGKTALAQKLAERVRAHFPGGVLWWTLGPSPDVFTALDVWARHAEPRADLSALPEARARAAVVRSLLAKLGRLCVMVDDVWQEEAARILLEAAPPNAPILLTTRDGDVAKALRCRLERIEQLTEAECVAVLANLLGELGEHEAAAREMARLTDGLPLAVELLAGLADAPADLPALAQQLRAQPTLKVLKLPRGEMREKSLEACLALSYNALDTETQRRFRALGVFAPAPFDEEAILTVWNESLSASNDLSETIRTLTRRALLTKTPAGRYTQHALLRAYALALLARANEQEAAAARHADYYRKFAKEKHWREVENTFEQIEQGWEWVQTHKPEHIVPFVGAVQRFLNTRGRPLEELRWLEVGLKQAQAAAQRKDEGTLLNNIARVYDALGQREKALTQYEQALAIMREVGDRSGEGTTLNNIAAVYSALGQKEKALEQYEQALAIMREVGDRSGEGTTLNNIARVYDALGQREKALTQYEQALAIMREVGDRSGEGATLNNIAAVYSALEQKEKALAQFEQALAIIREVGDRSGEGTTLNNIGLVYSALGQKEKALVQFEQALAIIREVGDRSGEGITLWNIGDLLEKENRLPEAEVALGQAVELLTQVQSPDAIYAQKWLDRVRQKLNPPNNP